MKNFQKCPENSHNISTMKYKNPSNGRLSSVTVSLCIFHLHFVCAGECNWTISVLLKVEAYFTSDCEMHIAYAGMHNFEISLKMKLKSV